MRITFKAPFCRWAALWAALKFRFMRIAFKAHFCRWAALWAALKFSIHANRFQNTFLEVGCALSSSSIFDSCESLSKHLFAGGLPFEQLLNFRCMRIPFKAPFCMWAALWAALL
jgi:hypothetical protein